ncbi:MAG: hypothetical protein A3F87_03970 [Omnitrophica WOR_2 bacterium RIFCSPLOWO2_12_FULL_51_24]|nr:MAG: hypothetical protein A3I43_00125 [Omnitrophica WOR_2 bacterium RIFCSPLOWO2_02_FULL_50_19]OGX43182.1 MAG: hypothetical protein A3F87_03970 [Omnitrophica WOR_2 bacterium RIFCSPLOWO2_12_FULL_51_24]
MFYVYVLKSRKNGKNYIGHTADLRRRIIEHNTCTDRSKFTCVNGPWDLFFYEAFETRAEAMKHEKSLKTGKGRETIAQIKSISR